MRFGESTGAAQASPARHPFGDGGFETLRPRSDADRITIVSDGRVG